MDVRRLSIGVTLLACLVYAGCGEANVPVVAADDEPPAGVGGGLERPDAAASERAAKEAAPGVARVGDAEPEPFVPAGEPSGTGEDWPVFLGPRENGVSVETGYADEWPEAGPPVLWKRRIGTGFSAPSIRGNRLVVHHRPRGFEEVVECLRADDGRPVWRFAYETNYSDPYGYNDGPRCSPLLTEDRCYTYGAEGRLACLDLATGEKIWMRDCVKDFSTEEYDIADHWFFGIGCTPVLEGDLVIALVGGPKDNAVAAFDKSTGETVWTAVGRSTWDGVETERGEKYEWTGDEHTISYSTPIVATIHGRRHLLCLVRQGLVSLDPKTGKVNFAHWFRPRVHESVNAARPVVVGDTILLSAAYQCGSTLLRVHEDGGGADVVWRDRRNLLCHWSTPLHVDGHVYGFSGRHESEGELRCIALEDGEVAWTADGREPLKGLDLFQDRTTGRITDADGKEYPWPFYGRGSAIRVEDRLVVLGERGTLSLHRINPEKVDEITRTSYEDISYPAWAAPVLSRGRLYLRDENTLLCLELPRK